MSYFSFLQKNLLYLSSFALILIGSFALTLPQKQDEYQTLQKNLQFSVNKLPILQEVNSYPYLSAQGVYAIDLDSSVVLYEKNPDKQLYPASTTKIVTALVAMQNYDLGEIINTGEFRTIGQKMGLVWNENILFEDLLYGLLIHSGNDVAEVLALNDKNGREGFIAKMNELAKNYKAQNTNFKNPSGLDNVDQYTTARDLVKISRMAMKDDIFATVVATAERDVESTDGKFAYHLTNRNELLGRVDGVLGVKTGWTEAARENLVTYVERDDKKILIAILGSQDRFGETEDLVEWIYDNYDWVDVNSLQSIPPVEFVSLQ